MTTNQNANSERSVATWYKAAAVVLVLVIALLFVHFAGGRLHHEMYQEAPPAGSTPGAPGPQVAH